MPGTLPAAGYMSDNVRTEGEQKQAFEDILLALRVSLLDNGKINAAKLPIGCGAYLEFSSTTELRLIKAVGAGQFAGHPQYGDAVPFLDGSGNLYYLSLGAAKTISNAGLSADTNYHVYVYDNAGVVALELSTSTPVFTAIIPHKSGDATRTLMGLVRTGSGTPTFTDTRTCSFWNRVRKHLLNGQSTFSTALGTWTEVFSQGIVAFAGDLIEWAFSGTQENDTAGNTSAVTPSALNDTSLAATSTANNPTSTHHSSTGGYKGGFGLVFSGKAAASGLQTVRLYGRKTTGSGTITVSEVVCKITYWG